jgi:hypothetical protein
MATASLTMQVSITPGKTSLCLRLNASAEHEQIPLGSAMISGSAALAFSINIRPCSVIKTDWLRRWNAVRSFEGRDRV